jgi:hypothetical protein
MKITTIRLLHAARDLANVTPSNVSRQGNGFGKQHALVLLGILVSMAYSAYRSRCSLKLWLRW